MRIPDNLQAIDIQIVRRRLGKPITALELRKIGVELIGIGLVGSLNRCHGGDGQAIHGYPGKRDTRCRGAPRLFGVGTEQQRARLYSSGSKWSRRRRAVAGPVLGSHCRLRR